MLTRRSLLLGAAGAIPAASAASAAVSSGPGLFAQALLGAVLPAQANAMVIFDETTALGSHVDPSGNLRARQELINLGGSANTGYFGDGTSSSAALTFFLNKAAPIKPERIFTARQFGLENFTVDLLPAATTVTTIQGGQVRNTSWGVPIVKVFLQNAARKFSNYFFPIYGWADFTWQLYQIFVNGIDGPNSLGMVAINHFIKGNAQVDRLPIYFGLTQAGALVNPPLFVSWGVTAGSPQNSYTVGAVNSSAGLNGMIANVGFDTKVIADPGFAAQQAVNNNGGFNRPMYGMPGWFAPNAPLAPIHLIGRAFPTSFSSNGYAQDTFVNGDTLFLDPSLNPVPGFSDIRSAGDDVETPFE